MPTSWREPNAARWVGVRPAHNGVQVTARATKAGGSQIIYTVPADKILYLIWVYLWGASTSGVGDIFLRDAEDTLVMYLAAWVDTAGSGKGGTMFQPAFPLEVPEGYDIVLEAGAGTTFSGEMFGWLEDA